MYVQKVSMCVLHIDADGTDFSCVFVDVSSSCSSSRVLLSSCPHQILGFTFLCCLVEKMVKEISLTLKNKCILGW